MTTPMVSVPKLISPDQDANTIPSDKQKTFVAYEGVKPSSTAKQKIRSHAMRFYRQQSRQNLELYGPDIRFAPVQIPTSNGLRKIPRQSTEAMSDGSGGVVRTVTMLGRNQLNLLNTVAHRTLHNSQLLSAFLAVYWPPRKERIQEHTDDWIAYLPFVDMSNPLLRLCTEAMCCVKLGVQNNSKECLKQYRSRYGLALPLLAKNLQSQTMRHDHLLVAMAMLLICELHDPAVYGMDHIGWMRHTYGAIQFAKHKGPAALATPLGRKVCIFLRHFAFCTALCDRKASDFGTLSWAKLMAESATETASIDLYNTIQPLPGLLEDMDRNQGNISLRVGLLGKLCSLFDKLELWHTKWHANLDQANVVRLDKDNEQFRQFQDQHCPPFDDFAILFPSISDCATYLMYWLVKIVIVCNVLNALPELSLGGRLNGISLIGKVGSLAKLEDAGWASATSFCRAMPYTFETKAISVARHISLAMPLIAAMFTRLGHCSEAAWCHSFLQTVYTSWEERVALGTGLVNEPGWTIESSEQKPNTPFEEWRLRMLFLKH